MSGFLWNATTNDVVPANEGTLPYALPGVLFGESLFETLRVIQRRFFRLDRHLERLESGVHRMGWRPVPRGLVLRGLAALLQDPRVAAPDLRVRITFFRRSEEGEAEIVLWAGPYTPPDPNLYRQGVAAVIAPYRLDETAPWTTVKSGNRMVHQAARRVAAGQGAWEALLLNTQGLLADGAITNVFFVSGGVLYTPSIEMGALPGIARQVTQDLAEDMGFSLQMGDYSPEALRNAEEAFLTNALIGILPLVQLDGQPIGRGVPGPITTALIQAFQRVRDREEQPLYTALP